MKRKSILVTVIILLILIIAILLFTLNNKNYAVGQEAVNNEGIKAGFETETYEIEKKSEENPKSTGSEGNRYSENIWEYYDRVEEARERTIKGG